MYALTGTETIVPRHKLVTARSPDGIRLWARDERVDYDTFHDRKSMYKLKSNGIEDDGRNSERKHDERRARGGNPRVSSPVRPAFIGSVRPIHGPGLGSGFTANGYNKARNDWPSRNPH